MPQTEGVEIGAFGWRILSGHWIAYQEITFEYLRHSVSKNVDHPDRVLHICNRTYQLPPCCLLVFMITQ